MTGFIPIKLYLQKPATSQTWPVGHSLLEPWLRKFSLWFFFPFAFRKGNWFYEFRKCVLTWCLWDAQCLRPSFGEGYAKAYKTWEGYSESTDVPCNVLPSRKFLSPPVTVCTYSPGDGGGEIKGQRGEACQSCFIPGWGMDRHGAGVPVTSIHHELFSFLMRSENKSYLSQDIVLLKPYR